MGEVVDLGQGIWRAAPGAVTDHDFAKKPLRKTKKLHQRIHSTYNGWWMCLFPREIIERTGLPLPLFIKHDDSEYSLRAGGHGYPTVTLPGAAIWHMPWTDKNDATDWTAYFHTRNRLILAALHSPEEVKNNIVKQGLKLTLRHLLSMEYSTVAVQQKAIEDFLKGPSGLFDSLRTALPEVRELRKDYDDAKTLPSAREFPPPTADPEIQEIVDLRSRNRERVLRVLRDDEDLPASLVPHVIALLAWDAVPIPLTDLVLPGFGLGVFGAWYAMVADVLLRSLLVVFRFLHGGWRRVAV